MLTAEENRFQFPLPLSFRELQVPRWGRQSPLLARRGDRPFQIAPPSTHAKSRISNGETPAVGNSASFRRRCKWNEGLGLISMRERLEAIGGVLEIRSHPGRGTRVGARVPIDVIPSDGETRPEENAKRASTVSPI